MEHLLVIERDGNLLLKNNETRIRIVKNWLHSLSRQLRRLYGSKSYIIDQLEMQKNSISNANIEQCVQSNLLNIRKILINLKNLEKVLLVEKPKIFLGHGHDMVWSRVQAFIKDDLCYDVEAFETKSRAATHIIKVLDDILRNCEAAVIVMTGEDETAEGQMRARQNVVHEIGLFQGRHGFDNVIVFQQENVDSFSNIHGLQSVRYSDRPEDGFYELGRALAKVIERRSESF